MHAIFSSRLRLLRCIMAAVAVTSAGTASAEALDRIVSSGKVVLAHREASLPFSYVVDNKPTGYSIDVCLKIVEAIRRATQKNLRVEYLLITPATRFSSIEKGEADFECAGATDTVERRKRVTYTHPHFIATSRLMVRSKDGYERVEDLAGHRVASTANTSNLKALQAEAERKLITLDVVSAKDHTEAFQWLVDGKVDAFAMDDILLYRLRAESANPDSLKLIGKPMTVEPYAVFFQINSPKLKTIVDAELLRLMRSGELEAIYNKWFMSPIPPKGLNLRFPMPYLLVDNIKRPTDFVIRGLEPFRQ